MSEQDHRDHRSTDQDHRPAGGATQRAGEGEQEAGDGALSQKTCGALGQAFVEQPFNNLWRGFQHPQQTGLISTSQGAWIRR